MADPSTSAAGDANFQQSYMYGDSGGSPCSDPSYQRLALVTIYCNGCPTGYACPSGLTTNCTCRQFYSGSGCFTNVWVALTCPTPGTNPYTPYGWSGAGIFFFVVFLLGLIGYVGKWVYNYTVLRKTGLEAVPLVDAARWLNAKITGRLIESSSGGAGGAGSGPTPVLDSTFTQARYDPVRDG